MTQTHRVYVRTSLAEAWAAVISPEFTRQYFFGSAFASPPVAGEPFSSVLPNGMVAVDGRVEAVDAPHTLVHTWNVHYDPAQESEPESRVTWTLFEAGEDLVRVQVVHSSLDASPHTARNVAEGWDYILSGLKSVLETGKPLPQVTEREGRPEAPDAHRQVAVRANNDTWDVLEADAVDVESARRGAYTAAYHWSRAASATPANEARALYLIAKTWLATGEPHLALEYADGCLAECRTAGLADFDLAFAHEVRARALYATGHESQARSEWDAARSVPIRDPEDRAAFAAELAKAPWA